MPASRTLVPPPAPLLADAPPLGAWARAWARPDFRAWALALVLGFALVVGLVLPPFFAWSQLRGGAIPSDPLLALLPRHDVALAVFVLMYGAVGLSVGWQTRHPWLLLRGLWAYLLLLLLRIVAIWLVPLLPPADLLPMPDPFTALFMHEAPGGAVTHDLFFSGHTATVVLLALAVRGRWWRLGVGLLAAAVGLLVLVQRVHYSYDVLAAPLFAWLAYWLMGQLVPKELA